MSQPPLLQLDQIKVVYQQVILAVSDISLTVPDGQIVALLGANGAGKSTTLKTISGLISAERGELAHGSMHYQGQPITTAQASSLVEAGLVQVLEGRHCFAHLTVEENLLTGALSRRVSRATLKQDLERIYHYFPRLYARRRAQAGYTSGGEQQMVAIGRALMAKPRLVLLDEPSMGLAPVLVSGMFGVLRQLNEAGATLLLVEQNATMALRAAHRGYVLETGRLVMGGTGAELLGHPRVREAYLGG